MDFRDLVGLPIEFVNSYSWHLLSQDDEWFGWPEPPGPQLCVIIKEGKIHDIKVKKGGDLDNDYQNIW